MVSSSNGPRVYAELQAVQIRELFVFRYRLIYSVEESG